MRKRSFFFFSWVCSPSGREGRWDGVKTVFKNVNRSNGWQTGRVSSDLKWQSGRYKFSQPEGSLLMLQSNCTLLIEHSKIGVTICCASCLGLHWFLTNLTCPASPQGHRPLQIWIRHKLTGATITNCRILVAVVASACRHGRLRYRPVAEVRPKDQRSLWRTRRTVCVLHR